MGDVADDMMNEAHSWAYDSETCPKGHRYLDIGWGCPTCEILEEEKADGKAKRVEAGGD